MVKKELLSVPILGSFRTLFNPVIHSKNIAIDRSNRSKAIETMQQVAVTMKQTKQAILVFPEGTRSYQTDNSMLPFKKGAFHLAVSGKLPVIPIVASTFPPFYDEKKYIFEPCTVQVQVLEPIFGDNVDELMERSRNLMLATLPNLKTRAA